MTILTISDVHLGYSQSNADELNTFLQALTSRADIDALVILGDFIDMWRRDVSGIFLENHEILQTLLTLKQKKTVYYVVGNHDYHLLELANHKYPLEFRSELTLPGNGVTYVFKHGYEFDFEQRAPFMELLCDNMSDGGGQVRSDVWKWVTTGDHVLGSIADLIELHSTKEKYLQHLISPPKDRLSNRFWRR